jgi:hypothetical protein
VRQHQQTLDNAARPPRAQASRLGLLSKLERAGLTLKDLEKALPLLDEIDAIAIGKVSAKTVLIHRCIDTKIRYDRF